MKTRVALYSLLIGIFALVSAIYGHLVHGDAISPEGLLAAVIVIPVLGFLIWLRWDWAVPVGRKRRAEQAALRAQEAEDQTS